MDILKLLLIGICIGMANVIPGVSGGTIAVVFNIYNDFVNAITFNVKKLIQNRRFVIPLLLGMMLGVLIFSKLITILYSSFPLQTFFVFTGLIIGSIPLVFNFTIKNDDGSKVPAQKIASLVVCAVVGLALILLFEFLKKKVGVDASMDIILPVQTWTLTLRLFVGGFVGAVAMIIPGISGSLLMLIMGVYTIVITSIPSLFNAETFLQALLLLIPNGIGVVLGLLCGAKLISYMLKKAPRQTYAAILGLLIGSAYTIFPGISQIHSAGTAIACVICFLTGAALAYFSTKYDKAKNQAESEKAKLQNAEE